MLAPGPQATNLISILRMVRGRNEGLGFCQTALIGWATVGFVMGSKKRNDEAVEEPRKSSVKLTPPPRVVRPLRKEAARTSFPKDRSHGWITVAVFLVLLTAAFGVFFYLPRWVPHRQRTAGDGRPGEAAPASSQSLQVEDLKEQAYLKGRAEQVYERVLRLKKALEGMNVSNWGGEPFRAALASVVTGERQFGAKDFAGATETYQKAEKQLEAVHQQAGPILRQAVEDGRKALAAGKAAAAFQAFRLVVSIDPKNSDAATGLERAEVLDEVLALLGSGEDLETKGDLKGAARQYRKAASLDPRSRAAQRALARVDSRFAENAFVETMSEGMAALDDSDYPAAREAFLRARAMRPDSQAVIDGLAQAEEGLRLRKIADHQEKALALEEAEQWHSGSEAYQAVLELDSTIRFAQEGRARCVERADLSDQLEFHIKNPNRLSDDKVLEAATRVLATASAVTPAGPKLQQQIASLERIIAEAATSIVVRLESDELTEVVIYKVGRLGKFRERSLELRPGTYTVVGSRRGYRDVRLQLVVAAGKVPPVLVVRCEEVI